MRHVNRLLMVVSLSLGCPIWLSGQSLTAERFLDAVSAYPDGNVPGLGNSTDVYQALATASPAEVARVLPRVLRDTSPGSGGRGYAALFLTAIAMRPDGAALLSGSSEQIAALLHDTNRGIQGTALSVTDWVIAKPETNKEPYLAALLADLQNPQTPQEICGNIISLLMVYRPDDPRALQTVLEFMNRHDLTASTRLGLVSSLGLQPAMPDAVNQILARSLEDPEAWVRAAALATYSDSTTSFHTFSKDRVRRIAQDAHENPQIRELARQALAGKSHLSRNIDAPPLGQEVH